MINKCFTYKEFDKLEDAFDYAHKAAQQKATYIEIIMSCARLRYTKKPVLVQHNAKGWIK